jgi:hypothetical protein
MSFKMAMAIVNNNSKIKRQLRDEKAAAAIPPSPMNN